MILKKIDSLLNAITMYRLVLYGLIVLAAIAVVLGFTGILPYGASELIGSVVLLTAVCYITNTIFAGLLKAQTNVESVYITALILFFVLNPAQSPSDVIFLAAAATVAIASKYFIAIHKKHLLNPVAIAVVVLGTLGLGSGSWWVSHVALLPATTVVGLLFVRKIRRFHLFLSFVAVSTVGVTLANIGNNMSFDKAVTQVFAAWPTVFFGSVMLTEPLTMPPTMRLQMVYGALVGLLFGVQFSYGPFYSAPESALVIGNIFSYIVSPKHKLFLTLKDKVRLTADMWEFVFAKDARFSFIPGQYMEWTLSHKNSDSRGNRRYLTIASSPNESDIRIGVKISPTKPSSFKNHLINMKKGDAIIASQLAGDFVLPDDTKKKFVFLAGGIGITPFRSIISHAAEEGRRLDAVLFYSAPAPDGFAYKQLLQSAGTKTGVKTIYVCTRSEHIPKDWTGIKGRITAATIKKEVKDYNERIYYLSGPIGMVDAYKEMLVNLEIPKNHIAVDYFPGY